jgi:hypothetical protein
LRQTGGNGLGNATFLGQIFINFGEVKKQKEVELFCIPSKESASQ